MYRYKLRLNKMDLLAILYLVVFCVRYLFYLNRFVSAAIWTLCGSLIFVYCFLKKKQYRRVLLSFLAIDMVAMLSTFVNKNTYFFEIGYLIAPQAFGILIFLRREKLQIINTLVMMLFFYVAFRVLLLSNSMEFTLNHGISDLIGKNSTNIVMIFCLAINIIYRKYRQLNVRYIYFLIGLLVSLIYDSSGGILSFVLFGFAIFMCSRGGKKLSSAKTTLLVLAGVGVLSFIPSSLQKFIYFISDDNSRFAIWRMYFDLVKQNTINVIFGANIQNNAILFRYRNMHNDFINWHYNFGLLLALVFGWILIYCGYFYYKEKNWYYLVIWGILVVRSMTDGTDYCFMSIWVFMALDVYNKKGTGSTRSTLKGVEQDCIKRKQPYGVLT